MQSPPVQDAEVFSTGPCALVETRDTGPCALAETRDTPSSAPVADSADDGDEVLSTVLGTVPCALAETEEMSLDHGDEVLVDTEVLSTVLSTVPCVMAAAKETSWPAPVTDRADDDDEARRISVAAATTETVPETAPLMTSTYAVSIATRPNDSDHDELVCDQWPRYSGVLPPISPATDSNLKPGVSPIIPPWLGTPMSAEAVPPPVADAPAVPTSTVSSWLGKSPSSEALNAPVSDSANTLASPASPSDDASWTSVRSGSLPSQSVVVETQQDHFPSVTTVSSLALPTVSSVAAADAAPSAVHAPSADVGSLPEEAAEVPASSAPETVAVEAPLPPTTPSTTETGDRRSPVFPYPWGRSC